jgi:hypothetical protein
MEGPYEATGIGVGIVVADTAGTRVVDVRIPGGAYDGATKVGWKASPSRGVWKYVNRSATPPAGITGVAVKDLTRKVAGLVQVSVRGRRGVYPVDPTKLPLTGLLILDPPTAETGQCGETAFAGAACTSDGGAVRCR